MKGEPSQLIGTFLLVVSAALIRFSIHILSSSCRWSENDAPNSEACAAADVIGVIASISRQLRYRNGFHFSTMIPLSCIPLLIFLMVRYVSLRIYQRN